MEPNFESLIVFAEIGIAYVAFSTIVAALQPIRGKPFTRFQVLLVHFYIESGSLNVGMALLPLVLWNFFHDELMVWRLSIWALLIMTTLYLGTYVIRRRRVRAPTPLPSLLVMVGYLNGCLWPIADVRRQPRVRLGSKADPFRHLQIMDGI